MTKNLTLFGKFRLKLHRNKLGVQTKGGKVPICGTVVYVLNILVYRYCPKCAIVRYNFQSDFSKLGKHFTKRNQNSRNSIIPDSISKTVSSSDPIQQ